MEVQSHLYNQILSYITAQKFLYKEVLEGDTKRVNVTHGKTSCIVKVYTTGTIQIQGAPSPLNEALSTIKKTLENGEVIGEQLLIDIQNLPSSLQEMIPHIDPVIVSFISETLLCLKCESLVGATFLLGAASEKAILLLIDTYGDAIENETNRNRFKDRVKLKQISPKYKDFIESSKSSKPKPTGYDVTHDIDAKITAMFTFCRICRNEVGHPEFLPTLNKGVILANLAHFSKYIETIYHLIDFYKTNPVTV